MSDVTYVFHDGKTYAFRQGRVVAVSTDPDDVQRQVRQAHPLIEDGNPNGPFGAPMEGPGGPEGPEALGGPGESQSCPGCGAPNSGTNYCPECGTPLGHGDIQGGQGMENPYPHDEPSPGHEMGGEAGSYMAKQIVTPNGLKGTVLGKVAGLWGDEVTIRLENGRIVKLPVGTTLTSQKKTAARVNPIERLERHLAAVPDGTRASLVARSSELEGIKKYATTLIREGVSYQDSLRLDQLVVTAEVEQGEVADAVAHLDDVESIQAPGFSMGVAEDVPATSREDASWLDLTLDEMIADAEATDFTKLMDEGPESFTAELPDVALADTGATHQMASHFIAEKTAGIDRKIADPYMQTFLARVEDCRRSELANRQQPVQKEAAAEQDQDQYQDLPDDSLFL